MGEKERKKKPTTIIISSTEVAQLRAVNGLAFTGIIKPLTQCPDKKISGSAESLKANLIINPRDSRITSERSESTATALQSYFRAFPPPTTTFERFDNAGNL